MVNKPDCEAILLLPGHFSLGERGTLLVKKGDGGIEVERGEYCQDEGGARICADMRGC